MHLGEISADSIINISVTRGDVGVNLTSSVVEIHEEYLLAEPFRHNNSIISFSSPDLKIEMTVTRNGEVPFFWRSVDINKEIKDGKIYHAITTNVDGIRLNRRNSFRVFIGENGTAMQVTDSNRMTVTIRDISAGGIGLYTDRTDDLLFNIGDQVHIYYVDDVMGFSIDVVGRVVRTEETEHGRIYGCRFVRMYPQVDKYIAAKQRKDRNKKTDLSGLQK